jgi:tetratricopeptide (TPR) repeat protein
MGVDITQKIETLFDLERYTQCIELCMKHLYSSEVELHTIYNYLIFSHYNQKDYDKSLKFVNLAISDYPDIDTFLYTKALVLVALNKPKQALSYIKKALSSDSQNAKYYAIYAQILMNLKNSKLAKEMIEKAIELDSNNLDFHTAYALILYELDQGKKAKEIILMILEKDPFHQRALDIKQGIFTSKLSEKKSILKGLLSKNPFDKDYQKDLKFIHFYYRYIPILMLFTIGLSYLFHSYRKEFGFLEFWGTLLFFIVGTIGSRDWRFNIPFIAIMIAINMYFTRASTASYIGILILAPSLSYMMLGLSYFIEASYQNLKEKNKLLKKNNINRLTYFIYQYPFEEDKKIDTKALKNYYISIMILIVTSLILFYLYPQMSNEYKFLKIPLIISFLIVAVMSAKNFLITLLYTFLTIMIINNFDCNNGAGWCLFTAFFISPIFLAIYNYMTKRRDDG